MGGGVGGRGGGVKGLKYFFLPNSVEKKRLLGLETLHPTQVLLQSNLTDHGWRMRSSGVVVYKQ